MTSKKSLQISIFILFFVSNISMGVICARLDAVSAGENHSLALMDDNTLWACGGSSYEYQLGLGGNVYNVLSLQQVKGENGNGYLQDVATFDAGWYHSLAADSNGTLWAWGNNTNGQLGGGSGVSYWDVPQKVHGVNDVGYLSDTVDIVYVSAGRSGYHSLVVDSNGYVYGFGYNYYGQCGIGSTGGSLQTPFLVLDDDIQTTGVYLGDIANIIAADAGVKHSLALDDEGHVWEWGYNNGYSYPQKVPGVVGTGYLSNIVGISTCEHSLAVDSNEFVYEWKYGNPYKVTDGEMNTASGYLENIVEVGAGDGYSMARTSDGHVLYWYYGESPVYAEDGEMGTQSGLLEGIISIGAGYYDHKLAICENGYGWAWGVNNSYGQFGVGDTDLHPEPTQMLCAEASSSIYLTKSSEIQGSEPNCARPFIGMGIENNYLVYDVNFGNPITNPSDPNYHGSIYDVNIIDHLPLEVDYYLVTGGGVYDANKHTVTWTIGELTPGDSYSFTLMTEVNKYARPGGEISNFVEMTADMYYYYTTDTVPVCNWGSEIIYVDKDANGFNNGTNWDDAYTELRDAFTGAQNLDADVTAIWVAAGTYKPVESTSIEDYDDYSFEILEDLGLFGHFGGVGTYETSTSQRNFSEQNNETILEGQIGDNEDDAVKYVVSAENIEDAVLDGFTIKGSQNGAGVFLDGSDVAIANCKLKNNNSCGIQDANYSDTDIHNCLFTGNTIQNINAATSSRPIVSYCTFDGNDTTSQGIDISGYTVLEVEHSIFKDHTGDGIYGANGELTVTSSKFESNNDNGLELNNVTTTVTNCSIENSGNSGIGTTNGCNLVLEGSIVRYSGGHGISLKNNTGTTILNNWIHNNGASGFYSENHTVGTLHLRNNTIYKNGTYGIKCSEYGADPNIVNCIIAGNDSNDLYRVNGSFNTINYCLLQNDHAGTGNITGDPGFMNIGIDADDLHLDKTSQCKDSGDPDGSYGSETDIDGEDRIKYARVDIGGDEYYYSLADFDEDGFVNFIDYAIVATAWQSEYGEGNYNETCDIADNNAIDMNDLALFCEDWLWQAAWPEKVILLATDFESGIPGSWTVVNGGSSQDTWTTTNPGERSSSYWTGDFCIVDSDWAKYVDMNEALITPSIDCSGTVEVTLEFSHYFKVYSGNEKCDVDISINNDPWQTILQYTGANTGGNITEDISELAADQSNVRIRWHYYDANNDWYWGIDNVKVIGNYRVSSMQMSMGGGGGSTLKSMGLGLESMSLMESSLSLDSYEKAIPVKRSDNLMLSAAESQETRPERLRVKSQKFYDITPETTISARQKQLDAMKIEPVNIKEILQRFDEIWLSGDLKETMSEDEYLELRKTIEESVF